MTIDIGPKPCASMCHGKGKMFGGWATCRHGLEGRLNEVLAEADRLLAILALPDELSRVGVCHHIATRNTRKVLHASLGWTYAHECVECEETIYGTWLD